MADCASLADTDTSATRSAEAAWLRDIGALIVAPPGGGQTDEVVAATEAVRLLAARARALLDDGLVEPKGCGRACTACRGLQGTCDVVRDLGALPTEQVPAASLALYRRSLLHACSAVFVCRRTLHPAGTCLFSGAGADLCGRVLAAAHRLG